MRGVVIETACAHCDKPIARYASQCSATITCSTLCANAFKKGKPLKHYRQFGIGSIPWNKGLTKHTSESVKRGSECKVGPLNPNYINGNGRGRSNNSPEYKAWRKSVFTRDGFTCQMCRAKGVYLEAHHVNGWAEYPELRFDVSNGQTLCRDCHKLTPNYKGKNARVVRGNRPSAWT